MKRACKVFLWIIAGLLLAFAIVAGGSSIKEWIILINYEHFQKEEFVVSGTSKESTTTENDNYYLKGSSGVESYEFAIPSKKYKIYSNPDMIGHKIIVYRNPDLISISFQNESVNVIFESDWRNRDELAKSTKSTLWIAVTSICLSGIIFLVSKRFLSENRKPEQQHD